MGCTVPRAERRGQCIGAVEMLLSGAVEDEHAGHLALHAPLSRARQILKARRSARRGVRTASAGLPSLGHRR